MKTGSLISRRQIIAVCSETHTKHASPLRGQKVEFFSVELGATYVSHWALNPVNAELKPIRHLLALVGAHHIVHVSRVRVKKGFKRTRF